MTQATPAKLSDEDLAAIRLYCLTGDKDVTADRMFSHIDAIAAERDQATKELAAIEAVLAKEGLSPSESSTASGVQVLQMRLSEAREQQIRIMRTYDPNCDVFVEADEIEKMEAAAETIGAVCELATFLGRDPEGCLRDTLDEATDKLGEFDESRAELAAAQQRLASLAVDPTKREELGKLVAKPFYDANPGRCWSDSPDEAREYYCLAGELVFAAGRLSRDAELADHEEIARAAVREFAEAVVKIADHWEDPHRLIPAIRMLAAARGVTLEKP